MNTILRMTTELRTIIFNMREEATLKQMSEELRAILKITKQRGISNIEIEEQEMIAMEEGRLEEFANNLRKFVKDMK